MKKRFIPLLALLLSLCIIVPVSIAQIMAAGAVQIKVVAEGGIVKIYGVKVDNGKSHSVSSASDEETSIIVPIKATPDEGYVFGSWSVVNGTIDNEKNGNANLTVNVGTSLVTLTANFVKTVGIQAKSSNVGGTVTASAEKAVPGGAGVTLTATPKDGYRLDGWTVDVPEDMSTLRDMVYVLTKTGNTATITVDAMYPDFVETPEIPDLVVTAHFEKEDAGHFVSYDGDILQEPHFAVGSGYPMDAAKVTGWSNDPNKEILVEFTGREQGNKRNDHLMIHTNNAERQKLISEDVSKITFDNGSTEEITAGALQGVQTTYDADAYKIGFTVTDKHSNVKHGTILLKFSGRALVAAEHGTVQYGEKTYNDGDVITFEVGKEVTISAAAADGYRLKEWAIEGVTPTSTEGDSVTFTVPDKFFSIKPVFEDTQVTVGIQAKSSNVGGTVTASAEKAVPGGAGVTLTATPKDGYRLDGWTVDVPEDMSTLRDMVYVLTKTGNTATITVDAMYPDFVETPEIPDLVVTAHFEKEDAGHFVSYDGDILQEPHFAVGSGYPMDAAKVTGWSNDPNKEILVEFTGREQGNKRNDHLMIHTNNAERQKLISEDVSKITFDNGSTEEITAGALQGVQTTYDADAYKIGFTVTDKHSNVKHGTILLKFSGRALVAAEHGTVQYGEKTYNDGDVITFEVGKEVTISAAAADGYRLKEWAIEGVTPTSTEGDSVTFTVPDKFFSIKPVFEDTQVTVGIQAKSSNVGGTVTASAEKAVPGGAGVTLTATPKDGYRLDGWTVDVPEDMSTLRDMVYVLTKTGNTATITVDAMYPDFVETPEIPDLVVTAHFEKEDAGHFVSYDGDILQEPHFAVGSGYPMDAAKVTGWSNDPNKEILVEFTGREQGNKRNDHLMIHTNNAERQKLISEDVSKITFDNGSTEEITAGALQGVQTTYDADAYKIGFTVTDKHSNVKHGTILLKFSGRALVAAEHGTVQYGEKTYNDGDVITFEVGKEVTISAAAADGYRLKEWAIEGVTPTSTEGDSVTFTVPDKFFSIKPVFEDTQVTVGIQAKSSNVGGTVTASAEKAVPGGAGVTLTATPKDGYRLDGWTVDVPEDMSTLRDMVYVLTKTGNTATITVDAMYPDFVETPEIPDLVVTAHFEKEDAGHFVSYDGDILQEPHFAVGSGYPMDAAKVTGWSNDPNKEILVEFTGREQGNKRNDHLMIHTNNAERQKLISEDVSKITFDNGSTEEITAGALQGVQTTYDADAYKIGFTVTDKHSNVKHGTILLKFSGRALVAAEHGTVQYGEKTYNDGDVITFEVGKEVTISAAAADGYRLKEWAIEGVTPTSTEGDSVTFTVPDKFFSIKPVFEKTGDTPQGPGCATVDAEHGKLVYNGKEYKNGDVIVFTPGETVTVFAKEDEGYYLDGWNIPGADLQSSNPNDNSVVFIVPDTAFTIKPIFESKEGKVELNFHAYDTGKEDVDRPNAYGSEGWYEELHIYPFEFYTFDAQNLTVDEAIAKKNRGELDNLYNAGLTGLLAKWPLYIERGTGILVAANTYPAIPAGVDSTPTYICEDLTSTAADKLGDLIRYEDSQYRIQNSRLYIAFIANKDVTVNAKFHELGYYSFKAVSNDETMGTVEITPECLAGGTQQEATHVVMRAIPKDGYRFKEWIEAEGSTYLSAEEKMIPIAQFAFGTKAASFTAVFEKSTDSQPLPIQATSDPEGKAAIEVKANGKAITSAKEGTTVVASIANVDEYYEFDHWEITTATEAAVSLIPEEDCRNSSVEFNMPSVTEGVRIKAVLKERYVSLDWVVMKGSGGNYKGYPGLADVKVSVNGSPVSNYTKVKKGDLISFSITVKEPDKYVFKEVRKEVFRTGSSRIEETFTEYSGAFTLTEWTQISLWVCLNDKTEETARHGIVLTQATGGTITSSNSTAQPNTTITLTAAPDIGYTLKSWIVKDEQQKTISVTADKTNSNVGTFTMPKSNVTVTAEFESTSEITPTITSVALLQGKAGNELATGVLSGDKWTITIPDTVSAETVELIPEGTSGLFLKIVTPTGVTVKQMDGGGSWAGDWSKGDIVCWMPVGEEVTFRVIAGTATKDYAIKLVYSGSPLLSDGSATRSSKTAATVTFTSNVAGTYYYKVVDHDAAAPTVDEIKKSTTHGTASAGETTFTISNLTGDARDVYIVVVAASGESAPLKIGIPAYEPNPGKYTITVNTPKGGTIIPNRTSANEGDEIIVTVTPDDGYQMVEGSLTYTLAIENGKTVKITNNRFTMPEGNVTISCQWETAATTSTGITAFSINGVAAAVNNTTNTITITMPRGTDVTKLTPVIATNGVKSLTPGSGVTMDFTNSVTYTASMEDGSTKTYIVTVYVNKGTLSDQFWDKMTDFTNQVPWWEYAKNQQSTSSYPKYW